MVQSTVDFPQLPFIAGRRFSCRGAEADSHGLACSEDHRDSAVAVCFLVVDAPVVQVAFLARCCARQMPMVQTLQKFVEVPQSQFLPGCAVLCSELSRDSEGATDSVHRRSQWTFQSPQRQVRTVAAVHGGPCLAAMVAATRGSLLQFCSFFRPPSTWTLSPRVAGTLGV